MILPQFTFQSQLPLKSLSSEQILLQASKRFDSYVVNENGGSNRRTQFCVKKDKLVISTFGDLLGFVAQCFALPHLAKRIFHLAQPR